MASRRTRIKGVANIPQRKKPTFAAENASADKGATLTRDETPSSEPSPAPQEDVSSKGDPTIPDKNLLPKGDPTISDKNFVKPPVKYQLVMKEDPQPSSETIKEEMSEEPKEKVVVLSEIRLPKDSFLIGGAARNITKLISDSPNESCPDFSVNSLTEKAPEVSFTKCLPEVQISEMAYPPAPASPSKVNRSRIKAIPKLNMRKASCSASESEDETRKYGRIRNNSVCSVASATCQEAPAPPPETPTPRESGPLVSKKINRIEQSRKFAEARREFHRRFGTDLPDKQKLKMIDLIFYNPSSNPMSQKPDVSVPDAPPEVSPTEPKEPEKENESENAMPVPQIKIGPTGEIILDEQSLVVENAELAKQKEQISNSKMVNGDFDTGYGVYKRARRTQPWTHKETVQFYKALNIIGTDFTLMTQLFPKRDRRELKMKFKKEEKINKNLIDMTIRQGGSYNFEDLKREIQTDEEEEAWLQKLKEEELEHKKQKREGQLEKIRKKLQAKEDATRDEAPMKSRKRKKSLNIYSVLDQSDSDHVPSSDEEEFIPFFKPTRSGRMPKSTIKFTAPEEPPKPFKKRILKKIDCPEKPEEEPSSRRLSSASLESNSDRLVPGSVVITADEEKDSKNAYKVFMVTPERKLTELLLESSVIERLVKERQEAEGPPVAPGPEQNVTTPAAEEMTRSSNILEEL